MDAPYCGFETKPQGALRPNLECPLASIKIQLYVPITDCRSSNKGPRISPGGSVASLLPQAPRRGGSALERPVVANACSGVTSKVTQLPNSNALLFARHLVQWTQVIRVPPLHAGLTSSTRSAGTRTSQGSSYWVQSASDVSFVAPVAVGAGQFSTLLDESSGKGAALMANGRVSIAQCFSFDDLLSPAAWASRPLIS